ASKAPTIPSWSRSPPAVLPPTWRRRSRARSWSGWPRTASSVGPAEAAWYHRPLTSGGPRMPGTWWPALRAGELIAYLTDDELQRLHAVTVPVLAEPGDVIFYKGAPSKSLIIVEEGEVQAA